MIEWVKTLYQNQALVHFRKRSIVVIGILILLNTMLITSPYITSLYRVSGDEILSQLPSFDHDFFDFLNDTPNLTFTTRLISDESYTINEETYTFYILPSDDLATGRNQVRLYSDYLSISNNQGEIVVMGAYPEIGVHDFQELRLFFHCSIDVLANYLKNITLSFFLERASLQYLLIFVQNTSYLLIIAFLFQYVSTRKPRLFRYRESVSMVAQSMFGPALISALIGLFYPTVANLLFSVLVIARLLWLYQNIISKKLSFTDL